MIYGGYATKSGVWLARAVMLGVMEWDCMFGA